MKIKIGMVCIALGVLLVCGAMGLALFNRYQDSSAGDTAASILSQLVEQMKENTANETTNPDDDFSDVGLQVPVDLLTEEDKKMTEIEVDGHAYIGYLSMPTVGLDLPVMSTWTYPKLLIAPCRYTGSVRGEDLVVMAHNFNSHFKKISQLEIGDSLSFTDMDGVVTRYKVVAKDIVDPTAVEEITDGTYDLTLFTCTYSGASRITVYCDKE